MEIFSTTEAWMALLTLTLLEVVLGVDNIVFISIVTNKLPEYQQKKARLTGLSLALIFRVGLLLGITWIISFTQPIISFQSIVLSGRDIILIIGGLFLIAKSTSEINHKMEGPNQEDSKENKIAGFTSAILQIIALDLIFSFDSILTAVGLTREVTLMIVAVVIAMLVMMIFAGKISDFIKSYPSLEVLALSFLILIGFMLVVEALHYHVPKGYLYFAVSFSLLVQVLNIKIRKKSNPVKLHKRIEK